MGPCLILASLLLAGCVRYDYRIVDPAELATSIGRDADEVVEWDPLIYRLRVVDNRLVMRIVNPTDEPIHLHGGESSVVDPRGQSRPVPGRSIAPGSYAQLVFPPLRPRVARSGPHVGVGVGTGFGRAPRVGTGVGVTYPLGGRAVVPVYVTDEAYYWDWRGESDIRLYLRYVSEEETFRHDLYIERRRR